MRLTGPVLRVGLTGGIGAGKSEVGRRLADHGAVVVDADQLAREVVAPGTDGLAEVVAQFGPEVLTSDGSLDRAALGARVFDDASARQALERIIHPRVRARSAELTKAAPADAIVVNEVPLLVEAGLAATYHLVVVVTRRGIHAVDPAGHHPRHVVGAGAGTDPSRKPATRTAGPPPTSCWTTMVRWRTCTHRSTHCGMSGWCRSRRTSAGAVPRRHRHRRCRTTRRGPSSMSGWQPECATHWGSGYAGSTTWGRPQSRVDRRSTWSGSRWRWRTRPPRRSSRPSPGPAFRRST